MKQFYLLFLAIAISTAISGQTFTSISHPFPGMSRGATAFADFDDDGDLDLIMSGQDNQFLPMGKIFSNTNGSFSEVSTNFTGLYNSALSIADYDHDGLQDIIITGQDLLQNRTLLYRNIGAFRFELADTTLIGGGAYGDVAFGDYNNDGFSDILLSGNNITTLYYNDANGAFFDTGATLPGMSYCSVAWGDYDNDGDKDILMSGDDGSTMAYVINNNDGAFSVEHSFDGAISGDACWGDHDMDGYLDFMFNGKDCFLVAVAFIYSNKTDNTFSSANAGLTGTALGPADWIDFDNDADLDVLLAGQITSCGNSYTGVYKNNGIGYYDATDNLAFVDRSSSAWGDYDNDGDWDVVLAGTDISGKSIFYRNDLIQNSGFQQNTPPSIPQLTDIYSWADYAVINWQRSTDLQSPQEAITYNLRIGSSQGSSDVLAADADIETGMRYVSEPGNMGSNTFAIIRDLNPGTYYYSIQSIDQAFKASAFSEELSFTILPTAVTDISAGDSFRIIKDGNNLVINSETGEYNYSLYQVTGYNVLNGTSNNSTTLVDINQLPEGLYIMRINSSKGIFSYKIII